ncbi:MAG: TetR/AcrR family transcriptional regulator [Elainellaceae cyanobacterium]
MARHKEFDRDDVLEKAMEMFWYKGYEATSVQDLINCMGINRGSLYDTFGDKHSLFLAALDRYRDSKVNERLKVLERSQSGLEAIRQFFYEMVEIRTTGQGCQGCLMVNSLVELALHDDEAAGRVASHATRLEEAFYRALMRARKHGEISEKKNLRAIARFLANSINGICVMAKISPDVHALKDVADVSLSVLN